MLKFSRSRAGQPLSLPPTPKTTQWRRLELKPHEFPNMYAYNNLFCLLSLLWTRLLPSFAFSPSQQHHRQNTLLFAASTTPTQNALFTQVISDVDDTLKSSGGVNVAGVALGGIDVQYERGDYYPGVAQFMLELSMYSTNHAMTKTPPKGTHIIFAVVLYEIIVMLQCAYVYILFASGNIDGTSRRV